MTEIYAGLTTRYDNAKQRNRFYELGKNPDSFDKEYGFGNQHFICFLTGAELKAIVGELPKRGKVIKVKIQTAGEVTL